MYTVLISHSNLHVNYLLHGVLVYALVCLYWLCSYALLNWTLGPTVRGAWKLRPSIMQ